MTHSRWVIHLEYSDKLLLRMAHFLDLNSLCDDNASLNSPISMFRVPLVHIIGKLLIGCLYDKFTGALPDNKLASDVLLIVDQSLDPLCHFQMIIEKLGQTLID